MAYRQLRYKMNDVELSVSDFKPMMKKPVLWLVEGNVMTKLASFNNEEAAELFNKNFIKMLGLKEET